MRARLGILIVTVLALAGGACSDAGGGDDLSSEEQAYVDAMVEAVEGDLGDNLFTVGDDPACLGSRWIEVIGLGRLEEAGIEPEDFGAENGPDMAEIGLDADEANELVDAYESCGMDLHSLLIDDMVADADESARPCFESALTEERMRTMMTALFRVGADGMDEATESGTLDPEIERALDEMYACFSAVGSEAEDDGDGDG